MKNNNAIKKLLLWFVLLLSNNCIKAQQALPCGGERIDMEGDRLISKYLSSHESPLSPDNLVRVYFHIFNDNDGSNTAATPQQVEDEFVSLLNSYSADNLCFIKLNVEYINSTTLNNNFNADTDPTGAALNPYKELGCINIFYMQAILGNNNACSPPCGYGGIALGGIPGTFFLVAAGNIGPSNTIGHEMGHCLGLYHTFSYNFGYEMINGSNGTTAGDKVADTPADPFAFNGQPCYSSTPCNYTGNCTDPNGAGNYSPPYTNLMAYWGCGNPAASNGQFSRVNASLFIVPSLQGCTSPLNFVLLATTISSGTSYQSAINAFSTSGNVLINNSAKAILGGNTVKLLPGFRAAPGSGYTKIITSPCN
jgi:Pregnancy-associated plasma protein-A